MRPDVAVKSSNKPEISQVRRKEMYTCDGSCYTVSKDLSNWGTKTSCHIHFNNIATGYSFLVLCICICVCMVVQVNSPESFLRD